MTHVSQLAVFDPANNQYNVLTGTGNHTYDPLTELFIAWTIENDDTVPQYMWYSLTDAGGVILRDGVTSQENPGASYGANKTMAMYSADTILHFKCGFGQTVGQQQTESYDFTLLVTPPAATYTVKVTAIRGPQPTQAQLDNFHFRGDVDGSGSIDGLDANLLTTHFGTTPSSPNWDARCDLNGDNNVDGFDTGIFAQHYKETIFDYLDITPSAIEGNFEIVGVGTFPLGTTVTLDVGSYQLVAFGKTTPFDVIENNYEIILVEYQTVLGRRTTFKRQIIQMIYDKAEAAGRTRIMEFLKSVAQWELK